MMSLCCLSVSAAICWCVTGVSRHGHIYPWCAQAFFHRAEPSGTEIYAEAGVASPKVARFAAVHQLEGAEFLAGIPGTIGGALAMNAGCYGAETWEVVARVRDH